MKNFRHYITELNRRFGRASRMMSLMWKLDQPQKLDFGDNATEEDIFFCFRLLLGRLPHSHEWAGHRGKLAGHLLKDVVASYVTSREFKNRELLLPVIEDIISVELDGFQLYVSQNDSAVGRRVYDNRVYEPSVTKFMRQALKPNMYVADVGANIGYFTMLAAHCVGTSGKVFAYEPFTNNVKFIYLSTHLNNFTNVVIHPSAIADQEQLLAYDNMASNGVISKAGQQVDKIFESDLVQAVRLDDTLHDVERLDLIKLDIEGAEYMALRGAQSIIQKHTPIIVSEFCPPALEAVSNISGEEYLQFLRSNGAYSVGVLNEDGNVELLNDTQIMDRFNQIDGYHLDIVANTVG